MALKKKILGIIEKYLVKRLGLKRVERFVPNINLDITKNQKKVLLIYLDLFRASQQLMVESENIISGSRHTNNFELFQIIKALVKLDCCIDVCVHYEPEAEEYLKKKKYDVILGLGEMFRYAAKHSDAYKILYMTENPYDVSYQRELERTIYFKQRTGREIPLYRTGMFFHKDDEKNADAIICLGEEYYFMDLKVPVKRIFPSAFYNQRWKDVSKRNKNNFLVLGTDGLVHKGNDLLIQVFNRHPEWKLYMCGYHITETIQTLGLHMSDNIYDCGYIDIYSDAFLELVQKCTFILQPSCSEGFSTGIATGMRHAMIPIVMHGNGFDLLEKYCLFFDSYLLEDIEKGIMQALSIPDEEIDVWCEKIYDYANQEFSLERFSERIYEVLEQLIGTDRVKE